MLKKLKKYSLNINCIIYCSNNCLILFPAIFLFGDNSLNEVTYIKIFILYTYRIVMCLLSSRVHKYVLTLRDVYSILHGT